MPSDDDKTRTYVSLTSGTEVGHYRIIDKIGAGGMGEVYLALDSKLNRKVALKFLPPHLCQDEDCRKRFTREAHAAAGLDHPNIAAIYEVGEYQGQPFFAMQVVEGQSLREVIAEKDLPIERILEIAIQVCEGLQAAHDKGIIHRDIKPSNVLLDSHGRVRIVDFGLASVHGSEQLTKTGSTLGTIGYMSPEQVRGQEVDHRSDLFSLGVVLYELLTRQNPFKRDSEAATLKAVSDDLPHPAARYRVNLPDSLQTILDKALEKDVKTRYQHADDLKADLMKVGRDLEHTNSIKKDTAAARRAPWVWLLLFTSVVVALAVVLVRTKPWSSGDADKQPGKIKLAVLPFENLSDPEEEYFADGMTDELISKLSTIRGLGVVSRTSCMTYKGTTKALPQIAHELGVSYILEGTIRWDKTKGERLVRITPQLIKVSDDLHLWSAGYERTLSGIFAVQSEIAENVALALGAILLESDRARFESGGTENTEAYLAFLRGLTLSRGNPIRQVAEQCIEALEECVAQDSQFARAWAELSMEYSWLYLNWEKTQSTRAKAEDAASRSLALDSSLAEAHEAMGFYYYWCLREYDKAIEEFHRAERLAPWNPRILQAVAFVWRRQGEHVRSRERLEEILKMDPRDALLMAELAASCFLLRDDSAASYYAELSLAVDPGMTWAYNYLIVPAWNRPGGLALARHYLEKMGIDEDNLDMWFLQFLYERDYDCALESLVKPEFTEYDGGFVYFPRQLMVAEIFRLQGRAQEAHAMYDSARMLLDVRIKEHPQDGRFYATMGYALAGLGRRSEAIASIIKAVEMYPVELDAFFGPQYRENLAYVYLAVGDYDAALSEFEYLFTIPSAVRIGCLELDPRLDPVRDDPRYRALVAKYGRPDAI